MTETTTPRKPTKFPHLKEDFAASLVVFLVALPLCVGVAVASGVPAELGLVTAGGATSTGSALILGVDA